MPKNNTDSVSVEMELQDMSTIPEQDHEVEAVDDDSSSSSIRRLQYGTAYRLSVVVSGASSEDYFGASSTGDVLMTRKTNKALTISLLPVTCLRDDGIVRVGDTFSIVSKSGMLHGYDSSPWLGWSKFSNRGIFGISCGVKRGSRVPLDQPFEFHSAYASWESCRVGTFPGSNFLGLAEPGNSYFMRGTFYVVQFAAIIHEDVLAFRYNKVDHNVVGIIPSMLVSDVKKLIEDQLGIPQGAQELLVCGGSGRGIILADNWPFFKCQITWNSSIRIQSKLCHQSVHKMPSLDEVIQQSKAGVRKSSESDAPPLPKVVSPSTTTTIS